MKIMKGEQGEMSVKKVIGVIVAIVIGLILLPVVDDLVTSNQEWNNNSTTATTSSMLGMITIFYVLFVVMGVVLWIVYETKGKD